MIKLSITIWTLLIVIAFSSCNSRKNFKQAASDKEVALSEPPPLDNQKQSDKIETSVARKIIKEGEITFETKDVNKTETLIAKTVQQINGYISKDEILDFSDKFEHRLTIRIPSDKFDFFLSKISESAEKLDSKNINVLDVTEEYIDVEARVKTKKELENRYQELLKQARNVNEVLSIEKELAKQREEIESVEGRFRFLKDRISFSTLTVTYYQRTDSTFGFGSKFGQAIKNGWYLLLQFCIAFTNFWAFIIVGVLGIYIYKIISRKNIKDKIKKQ